MTTRRRPRKPAVARPRTLSLTGPVTLRAASGEGGEAKGRRFSMVAYSGEEIRQWWSDCPVVIDMDTLRVPPTLPILYDHCQSADMVAGRADSVAVESGRIVAEGPVYAGTEGGRTVLMLADEGHPWQCSVGADVERHEFCEPGKSVEVNGRTHEGPVTVARGVDLREISFVVIGAAKGTSALVAKRRVMGGAMDFETWLLSMGFEDAGALTEVQRANLQQVYDAQEGGEDVEADGEDEEAADPPSVDAGDAGQSGEAEEENDLREGGEGEGLDARRVQDMRAAVAAEIRRQHAITSLCARAGNPTVRAGGRAVPLASHAVASNWTRDRVELEILRASRPSAGPFVVARSRDRSATLQAMQGAMILRAGGRLDHPAYGTRQAVALRLPAWLRAGIDTERRQRAMEAAHEYDGLSMLDLCREAVRLDGREVPRQRDEAIRAAFSGSALNDIFTTNINAVMLATYMESADSTGVWCRETEAQDFRAMEKVRLTKGGQLSKLPPGGTADHEDRSDTKESYRVARYAKQFSVDEQDVINDRFDALADVPVEMGLGAARLRPDLVYSILKANDALDADGVALFHSGSHANTDASAALAADKLRAGVTKVRLQRENGVNLNLQPTHLIVPTTLEFLARELVQSTTLFYTGDAASERGTMNALVSVGLNVVADARLDNGVRDPDTGTDHAGDVNDWFLAAASAYGIEVAYLAGTGRSPQVRSYVLDRGRWGIGWDVAMDIGAKALDYRGLYRGQG